MGKEINLADLKLQTPSAEFCDAGACIGMTAVGEEVIIGRTEDGEAKSAFPVSRLEAAAYIRAVKAGEYDHLLELEA